MPKEKKSRHGKRLFNERYSSLEVECERSAHDGEDQ